VTAHLDLDALADLLAGEGNDAQVDHVAGCPRCGAALDDLERVQAPVRAVLAALPTPEVPVDLAARLDAAVLRAREDELAPVRSVPARGPDRGDERPEPTGPRATGPAAPVVVLTRPGPARSRWLVGSAAAAAVLLALSGLAVLAARTPRGSDTTTGLAVPAEGGAAPPVPTSSTGTDYGSDPNALAAALPVLLRAAPGPAAAPPAGDPLSRLHDPAQLTDCLLGLSGPQSGGDPLALDYARFAGAPALVVVLPTTAPAQLQVYVVGAGCRSEAEDVLLAERLARPS